LNVTHVIRWLLLLSLLCGFVGCSASGERTAVRYGARPAGVRVMSGQWRPHYPYEHIAWVSPPWPSQDYVWLDFPEAIFTDRGLLYLSHVNPMFPVLFPDPPQEAWHAVPGGIAYERRLPDGVRFGGSVTAGGSESASLEIWIENGSDVPLREIRLQTCAFLRAIKEFSDFSIENKYVHVAGTGWQTFDEARASGGEDGRFRLGWRSGPPAADLPVMVTVSHAAQRLLAFTWYHDTYSLVSNPGHPCMHADPAFPDLDPGQRACIRGELMFFEGTLDEFSAWFVKRYAPFQNSTGHSVGEAHE
jgi:hypothetical protein